MTTAAWAPSGWRHPEEQGKDTEATMFFLLRVAFWLTVVLVLLPSSGAQPGAKSNIGATDAMVAAGAAVSDMSSFCDRQPNACVVGAQAAVALGQRAQAGAKMVYDFLSEYGVRGDPSSVTNGTVRKWPVSQDTLTAGDLEPVWQGPPAHAAVLPMPRKDPRRKA
jgi:hypothetical protein